ncbi:hypothetical protein DFH06DRAFT_731635 [Mycena polygramma]|nr:hypothetical protein DFH06DRAFT_731635 [Mycena polygramma]
MPSGRDLFTQAETHYYEVGGVTQAFELYRQAVIQITEHENVLQKIPGVPEDYPQELLASIWHNFVGCFKSDTGGFTEEAFPEGYDLLYSFRPGSSSRSHPKFTGPNGRRLLKSMQISAAFALAILAWNKGDRSTCAKRYQEALDIAATHPPFNSVTPGLKHLDKTIAQDVQKIREDLAILISSDVQTASRVGPGQGVLRKEVLNASNTRIGDNGAIAQQATFVVATDACGRGGCTNRGVNYKRCSACKKTAYCSVECQKEDWKKHKTTHV